MLDPSEALRSETVTSYFKKDYSAAGNSYFTEGKSIQGQWSGKLAEEIGLTGVVTEEEFTRLAHGRDPFSGEQLIERREGKDFAPRAAWDWTFNAPKEVSLTALVGGDQRVLEAHRHANSVALAAMQELVQQRMGGNNIPITTGKWIVASFEHNTARPDDTGYPAPHLHTHNLMFNMTAVDGNSQARAIQEKALFVAQKFGTAVYQAELAHGLEKLGYQLKRGTNNAPAIKGYSKEYLDDESPRHRKIQERLEKLGMTGRRAERIIAHQDRNEKLELTPAELKILHQAKADIYGNQPAKVVKEALSREVNTHRFDAYSAVEYARVKLSERTAVFDDHELKRQALRYRVSGVKLAEVEVAVDKMRAEGKLVPVSHVTPNAPGYRFTTPEMLKMERELLGWATYTRGTVAAIAPQEEFSRFKKLEGNEPRRQVLMAFAKTTDQVTLLRGGAGTGKTVSLGMLAEVARENGYKVIGLAPISKAVIGLKEQGIDSMSLQRFARKGDDQKDDRKRLFFVDEAGLGSTRALHQLMSQMRPTDHVILIGDPRQHAPVQAGFVFQQMMDAGVKVAELNKNYRQLDPDLKQAVNAMAAGKIAQGLAMLDKTNSVIEHSSKHERYSAIAKEFVLQPRGSAVVSPDNISRHEINAVVRDEMRNQGLIGKDVFTAKIFVSRDLYEEDRKLAHHYQVGDRIRYHQENKTLGVEAKSYAVVTAIDGEKNKLSVETQKGNTITYDPSRAYGVSVYEAQEKPLAEGERLQFTSPYGQFSNRDLGTIAELDKNGNIRLDLDDGRVAKWNLNANPHVDYAYAMTSHSIQSATLDRAFFNVEAMNSHVLPLLGKEMTYVASSRPRHEFKIFVDNKAEMEESLTRSHEKFQALSIEQTRDYRIAI